MIAGAGETLDTNGPNGPNGASDADDAIVHEVVYPHPPRRVWRALTDSAALARWLMPNDFAPRVGHRFTFRVEPRHGRSSIVACEVVELDEPRRLAYTWASDRGLPPTLVIFTLQAVDGGTLLRLEHTGFSAGGPGAASIRDLLDRGWDSLLRYEELPKLLDRWAGEDEPIP
ncbi:MAG: SRPBCC domain-containing protein [Chloroflexota bacterium]|nr:SRPBCC domain-containing protein [Chloroflexota bacterium]